MKPFLSFLLAGVALGIELEHFDNRPPLVVEHVETQNACEFKNYVQFWAPGQRLYTFDEELCACVYDPDLIKFNFRVSRFFSGDDCVPSPLEPGECYLQCQID